jgi:hypothetical protein
MAQRRCYDDGWFCYKGRPTSLPSRGGVATHGEASLLQEEALLSEWCGGATGANNIDASVDGEATSPATPCQVSPMKKMLQ